MGTLQPFTLPPKSAIGVGCLLTRFHDRLASSKLATKHAFHGGGLLTHCIPPTRAKLPPIGHCRRLIFATTLSAFPASHIPAQQHAVIVSHGQSLIPICLFAKQTATQHAAVQNQVMHNTYVCTPDSLHCFSGLLYELERGNLQVSSPAVVIRHGFMHVIKSVLQMEHMGQARAPWCLFLSSAVNRHYCSGATACGATQQEERAAEHSIRPKCAPAHAVLVPRPRHNPAAKHLEYKQKDVPEKVPHVA
jgi:hypothetical protein